MCLFNLFRGQKSIGGHKMELFSRDGGMVSRARRNQARQQRRLSATCQGMDHVHCGVRGRYGPQYVPLLLGDDLEFSGQVGLDNIVEHDLHRVFWGPTFLRRREHQNCPDWTLQMAPRAEQVREGRDGRPQ